MFKRLGLGVLIVAVLVIGVASIAFAQDPTPPGYGVCPFGGTCGGFGGGFGMGRFGYGGTMPALLAEVLGMTADELYAALADGQTIAELADAQGVEMADLVAAVAAPRVESLQQSVDAGYLTQEQADWMIAQMTEQMTWHLENFGLGYGSGGFGGGCGMWGGGGRWGGMRGGRWGGSTPRFPTMPWGAPSTS